MLDEQVVFMKRPLIKQRRDALARRQLATGFLLADGLVAATLGNRRFLGEEIGKGKKLAKILESMTMVAEGVKTCQAAVKLAKREKVEMPISMQVHKILFEEKDPKEALHDLLSREVKPEIW